MKRIPFGAGQIEVYYAKRKWKTFLYFSRMSEFYKNAKFGRIAFFVVLTKITVIMRNDNRLILRSNSNSNCVTYFG